MFAAAIGAVGSFAYEVGQYVYTPNGRFQITGKNLLTNGDFSKGMEGWTNAGGEPLSADTFAVSNDGPGGMACLTAIAGGIQKSDGFATSTNFRQSVAVQENTTYIVTYKAKAFVTPRISSVSLDRNNNYQNVFVNDDGAWPMTIDAEDRAKIKASIFSFGTCSADWYERTMDYRADSAVYLNVFFFNLVVNDSYTDFGIYEAKQVGDDRIIKDAISQIEFYKNDEANFPNERDLLEEPLADLKGLVGGDMTVADVESFMDGIFGEGGPVSEFLNANSADASSYFTNFTFDDLAKINPGKGIAKGWTSSTGNERWGVAEPKYNMTTNHLVAEIGANYALNTSAFSQGQDLPAGKYLYIVRGMANKYFQDGKGSSSNYYHIDFHSPVDGLKYFINNDTIAMENVECGRANVYMHVFDINEDGVKTIGFTYPTIGQCETANYEGHSGGGRIDFDNVEIRVLGMSEAELQRYFLKGKLAASRNALRVMTDSAIVVAGKDMYVFGKTVLRDSIAVSEAVYAANTDLTQECIDALDKQMNYMRDAIRALYTLNTEYVQLGNDIAVCKNELADENRSKGKEEFGAAIKVAEDYYKAQIETSRDSAELVRQDVVLIEARLAYGLANASVKTPAEVVLVNNSFQKKNTEGWTEDGGASTPGKSNWKFQSNGDFTDGYCAYFNRGRTATDYKWAWQDVDAPRNGVYMYVAECAVNNSSWTDTTGVHSDTYLFMNNDSIEVYTPGIGDGNSMAFPGHVTKFSIITKIADINALETPGVIRVGLEKPMREENAVQLGLIYFGSSHLYYLGSIEDYETGISDVTAAENMNRGDIYNLNGVKVRANATSLKGLAKGIYIMNGKKYVVK